MDTRLYTTVDRKAVGWSAGPWDGEPDKMQWLDKRTELPCLIVRHPTMGQLCGYVGLDAMHPLHGIGYSDIYDLGLEIEVHGGLTYANFCDPGETEGKGICHVPGPGEPDHVWWLGFDCHHANDLSPSDMKYLKLDYPFRYLHLEDTYKPIAYVQEECRKLAYQLRMFAENVRCSDETCPSRQSSGKSAQSEPKHESSAFTLLGQDKERT